MEPQVDKPLMTSLMTQSWNEYNGTNAAAAQDEKPGNFGKCVESTLFLSDAVKPAAFGVSCEKCVHILGKQRKQAELAWFWAPLYQNVWNEDKS